jgi:hypothetical protein
MDVTERYRKLAVAVDGLSFMEIEEIFKMIHQHGCNYTKNNNGVFVNLAWVPEDLLVQLEQYVEFCNKSDIEIRKYESLCDVLNSKLQPDVDDDVQVKSKLFKPDVEDVDIDETKIMKLSSSTRFMLLKKRFAKLAAFPSLDNELEPEPISEN